MQILGFSIAWQCMAAMAMAAPVGHKDLHGVVDAQEDVLRSGLEFREP